MKYYLIIFILFLLFSCNSQEDQQKEDANNSPIDTTLVAIDTIPENNTPIILDTFQYTYIDDDVIYADWPLLANVDFEEIFNEELQAYIPYPNFHPPVLALDGKTIVVKGFIIPLEETGEETILVLSANPFSTCFFCGGAGPETVMDIKLKAGAKRDFTTDEQVAFKGKLRLNDDDLYYLNYILEEAENFKISDLPN